MRKSRSYITQPLLEEVIARGYSTKEIAKHFNCSQSVIMTKLRKFGLKTKYQWVHDPNRSSRITKEQLQKEFDKGHGVRTTAKNLGISPRGLGRYIRKYNLKSYYARKKDNPF